MTNIDPSFFQLSEEAQIGALGGEKGAASLSNHGFTYQGQPYTLIQPTQTAPKSTNPPITSTIPPTKTPSGTIAPKPTITPAPKPNTSSAPPITSQQTLQYNPDKSQTEQVAWWFIPAIIGGLGVFDWVTGFGDNIFEGIGSGIGDIFGGLFGGLSGMNEFDNMFSNGFNFNFENGFNLFGEPSAIDQQWGFDQFSIPSFQSLFETPEQTQQRYENDVLPNINIPSALFMI